MENKIMKTISATIAILLAIKEFGDTPFSIWNITKNIRKNVRDGGYELEDWGDDVEHDMVKENFIKILDSSLLDDYYVHNNPNGYREYSKNIINQLPTATIPDPTSVVQSAMATTVLPKDVQLKIYSYLKGRKYSATMKQIQSRLKGHNYTCQELKDFLNKINLIDPQSLDYPTSQAWTVRI